MQSPKTPWALNVKMQRDFENKYTPRGLTADQGAKTTEVS